MPRLSAPPAGRPVPIGYSASRHGPTAPRVAARMATPSSGRPLNALVVESDPDYAVSVKAIAESASLEVTVTPEPEEGLRRLTSERFDLVVLAVREQDDVAALVGEIHDTSPSGVVILDEALGIAREAYDSGADQVLPKPFVPGHLAGAIRAALRTRGPESIVAVATTIRVGDVEFNSDRREVRWDDHFRVRFSAREWEFALSTPGTHQPILHRPRASRFGLGRRPTRPRPSPWLHLPPAAKARSPPTALPARHQPRPWLLPPGLAHGGSLDPAPITTERHTP
jgi:CheY-like chemotaxis protein